MAISWKAGDKFRTKTVRELQTEGWSIVSGKAVPPSHIFLIPLDVLNTSEEIEVVDVTQPTAAIYFYNLVRTRDQAVILASAFFQDVQEFLNHVVEPPLTAPSHNMWGASVASSFVPAEDSYASQWETYKPSEQPRHTCRCDMGTLMREGCKCGGV